jgi:hypothetical protein
LLFDDRDVMVVKGADVEGSVSPPVVSADDVVTLADVRPVSPPPPAPQPAVAKAAAAAIVTESPALPAMALPTTGRGGWSVGGRAHGCGSGPAPPLAAAPDRRAVACY